FFRQSLPRSRRQRGRSGGLSRRLVGPKAVANRPNNCASLRRLAARSRGRSAFRRANELDGRKPSRRSRQQETAAGGVVGLVGLCCAAIFLPLPSIDVLSKRSTCADFVQFGWPCAWAGTSEGQRPPRNSNSPTETYCAGNSLRPMKTVWSSSWKSAASRNASRGSIFRRK